MDEFKKRKEIIDYPKEVFGDTLLELGKINTNVVFISVDTSLGTGASKFKEAFPNRHIEFGIQEQNAMSEAAGLALSGKIPFIAGHVPFITIRCLEQIRDDLCMTKVNVNVVGRDFGFQLSALGPTHTVFEDVGILRTLPNMTIISPADGPEYREAILAVSKIEAPTYIRMSRQPAKRIHVDNFKFKVGKGILLKKGKDLTVIATSTMVSRSLEAAEILKSKGIDIELIDIHTIKPIDQDIILESSSKTRKVITVEEHSVFGGLGSAVSEILVRENPVRMQMIGMDDCFSINGESYEELLDYYGFTGPKIAHRIEDFLNLY